MVREPAVVDHLLVISHSSSSRVGLKIDKNGGSLAPNLGSPG